MKSRYQDASDRQDHERDPRHGTPGEVIAVLIANALLIAVLVISAKNCG
ncbi:hypothetical protein ABE493_07730 [Stenotrophomonas terrae]